MLKGLRTSLLQANGFCPWHIGFQMPWLVVPRMMLQTLSASTEARPDSAKCTLALTVYSVASCLLGQDEHNRTVSTQALCECRPHDRGLLRASDEDQMLEVISTLRRHRRDIADMSSKHRSAKAGRQRIAEADGSNLHLELDERIEVLQHPNNSSEVTIGLLVSILSRPRRTSSAVACRVYAKRLLLPADCRAMRQCFTPWLCRQ